MNEYSTLPLRIKNIYNTCNAEEQEYLIQILRELSATGVSHTYDTLWLEDYSEIPVDLDTFLCDNTYLGKTNRNGDSVYPYWKLALHDIFDAGNQYQECVFTGATRIGKTSTAITATAYMLYKLMCLRDPQKFFNKKEVSQFSIMFFNITLDLAKGVAFREFNDTLKVSPWFNDHGTFSKSERNFYYIPDGNKIVIDYGSEASHGLGKQVYCLVGDTQIVTSEGVRSIRDLCNTFQNVYQVDEYTEVESGVGYICNTTRCMDTVEVELEDGTIIEGTPDHQIMMSDGTYKRLSDLTLDDDIAYISKEGLV